MFETYIFEAFLCTLEEAGRDLLIFLLFIFVIAVFQILVDLPPFMGSLMSLFEISGEVSLGFQGQSRRPCSHFCSGVHLLHSQRFASGTTPESWSLTYVHLSQQR